jgi:hypothetical protein
LEHVKILARFLRVDDGRGERHMAASLLQAYVQRKLTRAVYLVHRVRMRKCVEKLRKTEV